MREVEIRLECSLPGDVERLYEKASLILYFLRYAGNRVFTMGIDDIISLKIVQVLGIDVPRIHVICKASDELCIHPKTDMKNWCEQLSKAWVEMRTDGRMADVFEILNGTVRFSASLLYRAESLEGVLQIA